MNKTLNLYLLLLSSILFLNCTSTEPSSYFDQEPTVRVLLMDSKPAVTLTFSGVIQSPADTIQVEKQESLTIKISDDSIVAHNKSGMLVQGDSLQLLPDKQFLIDDVPYGVGWWWGGKEDRLYSGELFVYPDSSHSNVQLVLHLPLEEYVKGVIPYEIGVDSPLEALKAQALAARTESVKALLEGKYRGDNYDICADVECQVYAGDNKRTSRTDSAVTLTTGEVIVFEDELIDAYFASNCGGKSERVEKVWPWRGGPKPYLISQYDSDQKILPIDPQTSPQQWINASPEVYCNPELHTLLPSWSKKNFRWERTFPAGELTLNGEVVSDLKIIERGESGRLHQVEVTTNSGSETLDYELAIRKLINPPLRSSTFVFSKDSDEWTFTGAGWGHGVGLCQSGSVARAFEGQRYRKILGHYYTGSTIVQAY